MGSINYIDIDWPALFKPIRTVKPNSFNRIRINREIIPIIFVPGIMGSRLKNRETGERVWDPDREIMCMLRKYGGFWNTPAQRKRMLIGAIYNAAYLQVDESNPEHNEKVNTFLDPWRADRGWGGVYWGSYGKFLDELQNHNWDMPVKPKGREVAEELVGKCFEFPVYAFGYNWTDTNYNSGAKLAERICTIKKWYKSKGRLCKYVILVSHSMGGLVCRSACMLHHAEKDVLGVIHGVQPVTGAAAAYWRMKAGFERTGTGVMSRLAGKASAWVLGTNGEEVTCILGNAPGGLELLPNQNYTDNNGERGWLRVPLKGGKELALPRHGDPYKEIYKLKTNHFWRLINPDWLEPRGRLTPLQSMKHSQDSWDRYIHCIESAEKFHKKLQFLSHTNTYQFFSGRLNTVDRISFNREALSLIEREMPSAFGFSAVMKTTEPSRKSSARGISIVYVDDKDCEINAPLTVTTQLLTMAHPDDYDGGGDGTVPDSSGNAVNAALNTYELAGVEHQEAYGDAKAMEYILKAVRNLALKRVKEGGVTSAK
jgi:hypothetical protein